MGKRDAPLKKKIMERPIAGLALPKCKLTQNGMGLIVNDNLTKDELVGIGRTLKIIEGANQFWIGDWINANWGKYEHGKYEVAEELGYDGGAVKVYSSVANNVERLMRINLLSFNHHQLIAPFHQPEQQKEWLQKAVDNHWTVRELRQAILGATKPTPPLPKEIFNVFYADPPWKYSDELTENYGAAEHHYRTMTIEELCELPIKEKVADNAVLFIWTTSPIIEETFPVITAWGFDYKTSFVWDKIEHNYGHYNSVRHEFLLVCVKGSFLPETKKLYDSVISIERMKHSEKPEYFRKMIEDLYPHGNGCLWERKTLV